MGEDTFISHLVELRDRLLRSLIAIGIVFLCLFPFASDLYDLLAVGQTTNRIEFATKLFNR